MKNLDTTFLDEQSDKHPKGVGNLMDFYYYKFKREAFEATLIPAPEFDELAFEFQFGVCMAWLEYLVPSSLNQYGAGFLLSDGFNLAGLKLNLIRIFARIQNNILL